MSVEASSTEAKGTVLIESADDLMNYNKSEERLMEKQIKEIADSGVNVVISGGSISQMAMHFIEKYNMMAVKITSKFELRRICRAVNATAVVKLGTVPKESQGTCESVEVVEVGDRKVTVFQNLDDESRVSTIVLRGSTMNILDDLERAVDDGVNTYVVLDNICITHLTRTSIETRQHTRSNQVQDIETRRSTRTRCRSDGD